MYDRHNRFFASRGRGVYQPLKTPPAKLRRDEKLLGLVVGDISLELNYRKVTALRGKSCPVAFARQHFVRVTEPNDTNGKMSRETA